MDPNLPGHRPMTAEEEIDWCRLLADRTGVVFATAGDLLALSDTSLSDRVPKSFLDHYPVVPLFKNAEETLVVATTDPTLEAPDLALALGAKRIDRRLVTSADLRRIRQALGFRPSAAPPPIAVVRSDLLDHDLATEPECVALLDSLLIDAVAARASDIHLERYGDRVRVRWRVDGDLHDVVRHRLAPSQLDGLVNLVKVRARLDIAEHRRPQGGHFGVVVGEHTYDLRVQTQPAHDAEHLMIRLLPEDIEQLAIDELGFPPAIAASYLRQLSCPQGLILVVGPTGSGKTTTIYSGLRILAGDTTRKIITIEDPVETPLPNVQQSQVGPAFGIADAMRAFVREDPDVIFLGEIRDSETAMEAIRASQTGHLVLSTLHCNDAVDAVQRLRDLHLHPNSIAAELLAIYSQRLAKRVCPECRFETPPDAELAAEIFSGGVPAGFRAYGGKGCERCQGFGFKGRIAVVEFLPATSKLRQAISRGLPIDDLRAVAKHAGLMPMRDHALHLAGQGIIAFDELRYLLPVEEFRDRSVKAS